MTVQFFSFSGQTEMEKERYKCVIFQCFRAARNTIHCVLNPPTFYDIPRDALTQDLGNIFQRPDPKQEASDARKQKDNHAGKRERLFKVSG